MHQDVKQLLDILESAGFSRTDIIGTVSELNNAIKDQHDLSIQLESNGSATRYVDQINEETPFSAKIDTSENPDLADDDTMDQRVTNENQGVNVVISYKAPAK